ncbi:MAG: rod shape-determining protein RodA [Patescibacteria group bacterium]
MIKRFLGHIDWILFLAILPILGAGLVTMNSFSTDSGYFTRQSVWIVISCIVFLIFSKIDFSFLKRTRVITTIFFLSCCVLLSLFAIGTVAKGAQSWFSVGLFSIQPSDPMKIVLILLLSKYFSRRHVEIRNIRHILVSGLYSLIVFLLIVIQPDFGGAIIIFFIWFGMVLVSGISKKHLLAVFLMGAVAFGGLWTFVFQDYQKQRIISFISPLADIRGAGYNAYQSTIAVGSGQMLGKGIGYGTQSKLSFLPEYQTDFIFAAFAEEWGFIGVIILFTLYGIIMWRILLNAMYGSSNFEVLFALGIAILFMIQFTVNVGMNIGLLPVTGVTIPFMSYGGSHLVTEFAALGILMSMRKYRRATHVDTIKNEFIGI